MRVHAFRYSFKAIAEQHTQTHIASKYAIQELSTHTQLHEFSAQSTFVFYVSNC